MHIYFFTAEVKKERNGSGENSMFGIAKRESHGSTVCVVREESRHREKKGGSQVTARA